jgi:hypothetical protein
LKILGIETSCDDTGVAVTIEECDELAPDEGAKSGWELTKNIRRAEDATAAELAGDARRDLARARERHRRHRLRLPRLDVVAVDLHVADRVAEVRGDRAVGGACAHGQLRDLVVEVDKPLSRDQALALARVLVADEVTKGGVNSIEVEALPGNLPDRVVVDLKVLVNIDDAITVGDLPLGEGVEVLTDADSLVARVIFQAEEVL